MAMRRHSKRVRWVAALAMLVAMGLAGLRGGAAQAGTGPGGELNAAGPAIAALLEGDVATTNALLGWMQLDEADAGTVNPFTNQPPDDPQFFTEGRITHFTHLRVEGTEAQIADLVTGAQGLVTAPGFPPGGTTSIDIFAVRTDGAIGQFPGPFFGFGVTLDTGPLNGRNLVGEPVPGDDAFQVYSSGSQFEVSRSTADPETGTFTEVGGPSAGGLFDQGAVVLFPTMPFDGLHASTFAFSGRTQAVEHSTPPVQAPPRPNTPTVIDLAAPPPVAAGPDAASPGGTPKKEPAGSGGGDGGFPWPAVLGGAAVLGAGGVGLSRFLGRRNDGSGGTATLPAPGLPGAGAQTAFPVWVIVPSQDTRGGGYTPRFAGFRFGARSVAGEAEAEAEAGERWFLAEGAVPLLRGRVDAFRTLAGAAGTPATGVPVALPIPTDQTGWMRGIGDGESSGRDRWGDYFYIPGTDTLLDDPARWPHLDVEPLDAGPTTAADTGPTEPATGVEDISRALGDLIGAGSGEGDGAAVPSAGESDGQVRLDATLAPLRLQALPYCLDTGIGTLNPLGHGGIRFPTPPATESPGSWFFDDGNMELLTGTLSSLRTPYRRYWVFSAGLTSVEVQITVVDPTGAAGTYLAQPSAHLVINDTSAFATCP